jgi:hypothetical protein
MLLICRHVEGSEMRLLAGGCGAALLLITMADGGMAQDQPNCDPPRGPGGIVGTLDRRVTQPIGQGNCGTGQPQPAPQPDQPDQPCRSVHLEYRPSAILYRHTEVAILTYEPRRCEWPKAAATYSLTEGSAEVFLLNPSGSISVMGNIVAQAKVRVQHGDLASTADISSATRPQKCTGMTLSYDPPSIHVRNSRKGRLSFLPENCLEEPGSIDDTTFTSSNPSIARVRERGYGGDVHGVRIGDAMITASLAGMTTPAAKVTIVNDGPPCENLELSYDPSRLPVSGTTRLRDRFSPSLQYWPPNCAEPETDPQFTAITHETASVDAATGAVTGLKTGGARIGVSHASARQKSLQAVAQLQIIAKPPCDDIIFYYQPRRFQLRGESSPVLEYRHTKGRDTYSEPCEKPPGDATFSAAPDEQIQFLAAGAIRGLAIGGPKITVKHGELSNFTFIDVIDGQPCRQIDARYDSPVIAVGEMTKLQLSHEPKGCVPPAPRKLALEDAASSGLLLDQDDGTARGQKPGRYRIVVTEGVEGADDYLRKVTDVAVTGGCTDFTVTASPPVIKAGEESLLIFEYNPDGRCRPLEEPNTGWITKPSSDVVGWKQGPDGSLSLIGRRGGKATVEVNPGRLGVRATSEFIYSRTATLSVAVTAPACTGIALSYGRPKFDLKASTDVRPEGGYANLIYSPDRCTRPEGNPQFTSDDDRFAVEPESGRITVHPARKGDGEHAYIAVKHGTLSAETKVGNFKD